MKRARELCDEKNATNCCATNWYATKWMRQNERDEMSCDNM